MDNSQYMVIQEQIRAMATIVADMDLTGFIRCIDAAETRGPIADPTLYLRARDSLAVVRAHAEGALAFQRAVRATMTESSEAPHATL